LRDFFHQPGTRLQRIGTITRPTISRPRVTAPVRAKPRA
jgi:hypothetical protein